MVIFVKLLSEFLISTLTGNPAKFIILAPFRAGVIKDDEFCRHGY